MDSNALDANWIIGGIIFFSLILIYLENLDYLKERKNAKKKKE
jgi:hypothetical protein